MLLVFYYGVPLALLAGVGFVVLFLIDFVINEKCGECFARNPKHRVFCNNCGTNLTVQPAFSENSIFDRKTLLLSFFIPFLGIYMWYQFREVYRNKTRYLRVSAIGGSVAIAANAYGGLFVVYYGLFRFFYGF